MSDSLECQSQARLEKSSAVSLLSPLIEWLGRNTGVIKQSFWKTEIRMAVGTSPTNNVEIYVQYRELQLADYRTESWKICMQCSIRACRNTPEY